MEFRPCDVAVVGGSLAALRAAIAAREAGAEVILLSRGIAGRSGAATVASNDLCGYIPDPELDDSEAQFAADTMAAGQAVSDPLLVAALAADAGVRIQELSRFGVELVSVNGKADRTQSAGHTRPRSFRVAVPGGRPVGTGLTLPLRETAERLGVHMLDRCPVIELVQAERGIAGLYAVRLPFGEPITVQAKSVVLACGGGSFLYLRTNTTSDVMGEGYGLALEAGASLRDMEFVQFHPTRMDYPVARMLSEGLIHDGAVLRNRHGEEFMYRHHPKGTMAPRDSRCRAIVNEIAAGNGIDGYVLLDCSTITPERLALRHQRLADQLQKHGVNFPQEALAVSPAAHFFMGGVVIDPHGATRLPGLWAAGEVAGGVHGANRVGSAAFSEALVFGQRAGRAAAEYALSIPDPVSSLPIHGPTLRPASGGSLPDLAIRWRRLRETMWQHVGIRRDSMSLQRAAEIVPGLRDTLTGNPANWTEVVQLASLRLALLAAEAVIRAAMARQESRGAHWRADFPNQHERFTGNIQVHRVAGRWVLDLDTSNGSG